MRTPHVRRLLLPLATLFLGAVALADETRGVAVDVTIEKLEKPVPEPTAFVTQHTGTFNGRKLEYTATAGETYLHDGEGKPKAAIFTFDYVKKSDGKDSSRPVTFVWNGGPGSAALWLHMGTLGPRRISVPSDASYPGAPPYAILPAPETILDVTDLVFVDPVGTGFSRALGKYEDKEFWGLTEDTRSIAEFIRDWVTAHGRWNSPKFILGESYGTTRAAAVAKILESEMMLSLNGIVFVSQALDYAGSSPYMQDNLISYITYVPTMAAVALYHGRVKPEPSDREAFLREARRFASHELMPALFDGNTLDASSRAQIRDRLAYFTGIGPQYIERANLRINGFRFAKELLRDQGKSLGLLDARYVRDDIDDVGADIESDAFSDAVSSAFKSALMDYMRRDLKVDWDRVYRAPADDELNKLWRWRPVPDGEAWEPKYVNTAGDLSEALRINPSLRVMVASGYYDLVTPFFDAEFTLGRHEIQSDRIQFDYYEGGHMMYVIEASRLELLQDVRSFMQAQLSAER
jgi:carboxypeptidase C (cathepsin A)